MAGCIILLKGATAIRKYHCHEWAFVVCNNLLVGGNCHLCGNLSIQFRLVLLQLHWVNITGNLFYFILSFFLKPFVSTHCLGYSLLIHLNFLFWFPVMVQVLVIVSLTIFCTMIMKWLWQVYLFVFFDPLKWDSNFLSLHSVLQTLSCLAVWLRPSNYCNSWCHFRMYIRVHLSEFSVWSMITTRCSLHCSYQLQHVASMWVSVSTEVSMCVCVFSWMCWFHELEGEKKSAFVCGLC